MQIDFHFHRPAMALNMVDAIEGRSLTNASAGLFLFAPRRTGKTTFILGDVVPALENRGYLCLYIDLWSDKTKAADAMLREAIAAKMKPRDGVIQKVGKAIGVSKFGLPGGTSLEVAKPEASGVASIPDALQALIAASQLSIVVIVDEAQHALTTDSGSAMLFALKSARDTINAQQGNILKLIMTGSSRDKLGYLVLNKQQPFFGAGISELPHLDMDFIEAFTAKKNELLEDNEKLLAKDVYDAFQLTGYRPEKLESIIGEVVSYGRGPMLGQYLRDAASAIHKTISNEAKEAIQPLSAIQKGVLMIMAKEGNGFTPFSESTITRCAAIVGKNVTTANIQKALDALRKKDFVWKSSYGQYAINDEMIRRSLLEDLLEIV